MSFPAAQPNAQSMTAVPSLQPTSPPSSTNVTAQNVAAALNPQSQLTTPPAPPHPFPGRFQSLKTTVLRIKSILSGIKWKGNIGTIATVLSLIAAIVYGPPAWKLAQEQVTLAIQGMRLSQWATCADHAEIQNTTTCRNILSTDFDAIGKRSLNVIRAGVGGVSFTIIIVPVLTLVLVSWILYDSKESKYDGFGSHVFLVSASEFFAESYALFATNVILPTLAFIYWPNTTNGIPELTITCVTLAGYMLGQLLFGILANRYGWRKFYGIELLITIISTIGLAQVSNGDKISALGWIIFWRFVMGLGTGAGLPLTSVVTAEFTNVNVKARRMAIVFLMQPLGQLAAVLTYCVVLTRLGQQQGFGMLSGDRTSLNTEDLRNITSTLDNVWRYVTGVGACPAIVAIIYRSTMPESPRDAININHDSDPTSHTIPNYGSIKNKRRATRQLVSRLDGAASNQASVAETIRAKDYSKYDESKEYFWVRGNGLYLVSTSMCWFLINFAFHGIGIINSHVLAALWDSTGPNLPFPDWKYINSTGPDDRHDGSTPLHNAHNNPLGNVYNEMFIRAEQYIVTTSIGALLGSIVLIILVDSFRHSRWLVGSFLSLALFFATTAVTASTVDFWSARQLTTMLCIIGQFLFYAGPIGLMYLIPPKIFPIRYRCYCCSISGAMGTLGSICAHLAFKSRNFSSDRAELNEVLKASAALMVLGAFIAWAWLPDMQDGPQGDRQASMFSTLPSKTLGELAGERAYAVVDLALSQSTHVSSGEGQNLSLRRK